mmetsp:Transcript_41427/g.89790  ORF Transcript_41427/g.89790 Transcript_41427/m.89790 type:complete len:185 (+) Transcript_41427:65-619(+)
MAEHELREGETPHQGRIKIVHHDGSSDEFTLKAIVDVLASDEPENQQQQWVLIIDECAEPAHVFADTSPRRYHLMKDHTKKQLLYWVKIRPNCKLVLIANRTDSSDDALFAEVFNEQGAARQADVTQQIVRCRGSVFRFCNELNLLSNCSRLLASPRMDKNEARLSLMRLRFMTIWLPPIPAVA